MVLDVDFDTGEITPSAALKWPRRQTAKFATQIWATDNPIAGVLNSARPAAFPKSSIHNRPLYIHPIFYSNQSLCWEAERDAFRKLPGGAKFSAGEAHPAGRTDLLHL